MNLPKIKLELKNEKDNKPTTASAQFTLQTIKIIDKKLDDDIDVTEQDLAIAYSECGQTKKACNCNKSALAALTSKIQLLDLQLRIQNLKSNIK